VILQDIVQLQRVSRQRRISGYDDPTIGEKVVQS